MVTTANLLLTIVNDVKIGDFGLTLSTVGKKSIQLTRDSGSIYYNSPETVDDTKYSHKTYIWSVLQIYN
jgi:serine/threonine protein kinase